MYKTTHRMVKPIQKLIRWGGNVQYDHHSITYILRLLSEKLNDTFKTTLFIHFNFMSNMYLIRMASSTSQPLVMQKKVAGSHKNKYCQTILIVYNNILQHH